MSAVATGIMRSSLNNHLSQNSKSSFRTRQLKTSAVVGGTTMKSEEMSGEVILEGPGSSTRRYVHIKVYRTSLEHFAVVCPMSKVSRPLGIINLRTAVVERLSSENHPQLAEMKNSPPSPRSGFVIRQKVFDTTTCLRIFLSSSDDNFEAWWKAFSTTNAAANGNHRNSPLTTAMQYGSCLPIVVEEEDD